jgi:hypothetical protein
MSDEKQTAVPDGAASSRRRTTAWIIGIAAAAVILGTIIAFALMPRDSSAETAPSASATASPRPSESGTPSEAASPVPLESPGAPSPSPSAPAEADPFPELAPVEPEQPGSADGITASLTRFESVTGEVVGPGDVAAAAVRVTVDITNTGTNPLDLNLVVVNAFIGEERDPAETYEQPGGDPVNGSLAPGETATGVYLFRIPEDRRDDVIFVLDYRAGLPAITFRGPVP